MTPANKAAENLPTRKRGRPRKEKPPKRARGRPRDLKSEVLGILFEFILSPEMHSGGRSSCKRALRAAAVRVKIPVPASVEAPPFPDLLARAKSSFERKRPVTAFDTYEEAERTVIGVRSAAPTRSLTPKEQKKFVESASRFLKKTKAITMVPSRIPPGDYQLCAGCGEVLGGGDPCLVRSVLDSEVGIPVKVYVHPKTKEHSDCVSNWHKSGDSQTLDRLDLATLLMPQNGDEGDFHLAQIEVPGVYTVTCGGRLESGETEARRKKLEKWVKSDVLKLFPEELKEKEKKLFFRRDEYGLDIAAQRDEQGGNTRFRATEGLSKIDGDPDEDERTDDVPLPVSNRAVAIGKNHVEEAVLKKLVEGNLGRYATEAAAIGLKARQENNPIEFRETVLERTWQSILGRWLQSILARISDGNPERIRMTIPRNTWEESATCSLSYIEDLVAKETDKELDRRFRKDIRRINENFQYGLIDRTEKDQRQKEARTERDKAKKRGKEERKELERDEPRLESLDKGIEKKRFDPPGERSRMEIVGKGDFRSKFRGSFYECDAQDREGEAALYDNHRLWAPNLGRGWPKPWRDTFSTYLLDIESDPPRLLALGCVQSLWPREVESLTDEQIEQRKRARLEWKEYSKKVDRKSNKLGPVHPNWSPLSFEERWGAFRQLKTEVRDLTKEPDPVSEPRYTPWPPTGAVIDSTNLGFGRVVAFYKKRKGMKIHFAGEQDRFYPSAELGLCDFFEPDKKKRLRDDEKLVNELAEVSKELENAVAWWPWNPREAELKFTFSGKRTRGAGFLFDKGAKSTLDKIAEFARAQWKHKQCKQYDPGMIYEIDGVTPVPGGKKPMSREKFLACVAAEIVRMDGRFKRKFGGAYFLADLVSAAFRRERFFDSVEDSFTGLIRRVRRSISPNALADAFRFHLSLPEPSRVLQSPQRPTMIYKRFGLEGKVWWESYYPYWDWTDRQLHTFGVNEWNVGRVKVPSFIPQIALSLLAERIKRLPLDVRVSPIRQETSVTRVTISPERLALYAESESLRAPRYDSPAGRRQSEIFRELIRIDADFSEVFFTPLYKGEGQKAPLAA